ncbi:MAG: hypothetical protein R3263_08665, partial [Myxococcota bacterium]|nr:hypothetical protein [Myxococcota bacterium]
RRAAAAGAAALLAAATLLAALPAAGAGRRVEVVGVAPAGEHAAQGVDTRQAALDDALARAPLRVAAELLGRPPQALEAEGGLEALLPRAPTAYVLEFRVLEDRGVRPARLQPDPEVAEERALLVEVGVDAERLSADLRAAGHLPEAPAAARGGAVAVELEGVPSWRAWAGVRDALRAAGAEEVVPRRFAAGRAEILARGAPPPSRLLARLERSLPEGLEVVPLEVVGDRLRLRVRDRRPPPEPAGADAPEEPGA